MSVKKLFFHEADVDNSLSRQKSNQKSSELDRPLSLYDNIKAERTSQINYSPVEIKFRFDEDLATGIMRNTSSPSAVHCNNINKQTTTLPVHKYENVFPMRNQRESDQEVKTNLIDEHSTQRSVMSPAKSSFFGLNDRESARPSDNYVGSMSDNGNAKPMSTDRPIYMNVMEPRMDELKVETSNEKSNTTPSASGCSSTTVTPSSGSPIRERTENGLKTCENNDRCKSPKFMLPETSCSSPSQVNYPRESCFSTNYVKYSNIWW